MPGYEPLSVDLVRRARERLDGHVHRTPLVRSESVGRRLGVETYLKLERLRKTGSFKPRGAFNKLLTLTPEERAAGVVGVSDGNHAQGLAFAARRAARVARAGRRHQLRRPRPRVGREDRGLCGVRPRPGPDGPALLGVLLELRDLPDRGWLVDRYDVKWVYAAGFLAWSLATLTTGFVGGFASLLALRLLLGTGESVAYPATSRVVVENFAGQRSFDLLEQALRRFAAAADSSPEAGRE